MEELFENLQSISWWVSVVAVGIIVNLASDTVKSILAKTIGIFTDRLYRVSKSRQKRTNDDLDRLKENISEQIFFSMSEIRSRLRATISVLIGVNFYVFGFVINHQYLAIFAFAFGSIVFVIGIKEFQEASYCRSVLEKIRRKQDR